MTDLIVTLAHVRLLRGYTARQGYCVPGLKLWFAAKGLDWGDFVKNGIPAQKIIDTGDALAIEAVKLAQELERAKL